MLFDKVMLLAAAVGWIVVTCKLRSVLRGRNPHEMRMYVWAAAGYGLTAVSYLIRVIYPRHGAVNIPAFVICIGGTTALFIAVAEGGRLYWERRDNQRKGS